MLQRFVLQPSPRPTLAHLLSTSRCGSCICRCSFTFPASNRRCDNGNGSISKRKASTRLPAPGTKDVSRRRVAVKKEWRDNVVASDRQALDQELAPSFEQYDIAFFQGMKHAKAAGQISVGPEACMLFVKSIGILVFDRPGGRGLDTMAVKKEMEFFHITDKDLFYIACWLRGKRSVGENRMVGRQLLAILSRMEYANATYKILHQAHKRFPAQPTVYRNVDISHSLAHLQKLVQQKHPDHRALVIASFVASDQGNEEKSIDLLTTAVKIVVALSKSQTPEVSRALAAARSIAAVYEEQLLPDLSSPWIELFLKQYSRVGRGFGDAYSKAEWAAQVGCEQDDPMAHYLYSQLLRKNDADGNVEATSEWLYHVTKAAASSHPRACYDLGVYYSQSGWKYLVDEPPDHVKPTPFDTYPSSLNSGAARVWDKFWQTLGFTTSQPDIAPRESMFQIAHWPSTAVDRQKLAFKWLERSVSVGYMPAVLFSAQICLTKTLWAQATAPRAALDLSSDRYSYEGEADRTAASENERAQSENAVIQRFYEDVEDTPNPLYDIVRARDFLTRLFDNYQAYKMYEAYRNHPVPASTITSKSRQRNSAQLADNNPPYLPPHVKKMIEDIPLAVREGYVGEWENLIEQAKGACDEHGIDIRLQDGSLAYKARSVDLNLEL